MANLEVNERKAREDLRHSLELYDDIENFHTLEDISEGVASINDAAKAYRHVHVELQVELGDEYATKYPNYDKTLERVNVFIKRASKQRKILKDPDEKLVDIGTKVGTNGKGDIEGLRVNRDILDMRIKQVNNSVDIDTASEIAEVNEYIQKMESFLDEYFDLCGRYKHSLGEEYDEAIFEDDLKKISGDVKIAKTLRKKLTDKSNEEVDKKAELAKDDLKRDMILRGQNLSDEISKRLDMLEMKYGEDLDSLGDYQILEISQNKNLDLEFNTVLTKVTDLSALVLGGGADVKNLWEAATKKRDIVAKKRTDFLGKLQSVIKERDVTPEKMKNATTLRIELPKFGGYGSKMDLYTFKSEFKKLVEPVVQKQFLADYLKRNYLSGSALNLVEKETDYSKIWEKLKESYGNQRLLLQNKLS